MVQIRLPENRYILRYQTDSTPVTPFNPIDDYISWLNGLRSKEYVNDVLREVHGERRKSNVNIKSKLISLHAENAIDLIDQALTGSAKTSFLPLYYSILNLSKIYIVLSGRIKDMQKYRYHGVTYPPNKNQGTDFLKESVTLKKHGIFPIFYEVLTGQNWQFENKIIAMSEIYPFIINVSHEYVQAYSMPVGFQGVNIWIDNISGNKYQLFGLLHESPHLNSGKLRCLKIFRGVKNSKNTKNRIEGDIVSASSREEAEVKLEKNIFRFLLYYSRDSSGNFTTYTPISGSNFLLPEEIPIWLAFFHLSNVVRYNPEAMEKITTSKAWPILLTLRHHSLHKYLQLFWSNFHQKNYMLVVG